MSVVLTGMAQLQGVIADMATGTRSPTKAEAIKSSVSVLPELPVVGPEACLAFSDWLHSTRPALADVSDSSEELWDKVLEEANLWYARHLRLDAITRLTDKPTPSSVVLQPRWARVSRRIEGMILAAAPQGVRDEDTVDLLRKWKRWCSRMLELGGVLPDSSLQLKALERITKATLQAHPEVQFRVNLTRASLQIDTCPDSNKVEQLHAQLLAELEALSHRMPKEVQTAPSCTTGWDSLRDRIANQGNAGLLVSEKHVACARELIHIGQEQDGLYDRVVVLVVQRLPQRPVHGGLLLPRLLALEEVRLQTVAQSLVGRPDDLDVAAVVQHILHVGHQARLRQHHARLRQVAVACLNAKRFLQADRAQRCKNCGAKGHRSNESRAGMKTEEKAKFKSPPPNPKNTANPKASDANLPNPSGTVPTKDSAHQHIKSMLADAALLLQQAVPTATPTVPTVPAVPISPAPKAPSGVNANSAPTSPTVAQGTPVTLAALSAQIDSLRALAQEHEIRAISVKSEAINKVNGIVQMEEHWKGLKVTHPVLGPLKTGISPNTCPFIQEDQALRLIGELEAERLKEFDLSVQAMEAELRQLSSPLDPTEALRKFVSSSATGHLIRAVFAQPYLQQLPESLKARLCDGLPGVTDQHAWSMLKRLPLPRPKRRALLGSKQWVVYLGAGPVKTQDPLKQWCDERNVQYLPVDLLQPGGKGWDLTVPNGVWSVLLWAAANGRVAAVLSSPPHRTWFEGDPQDPRRSSEDVWSSSEVGSAQFKENLFQVQDMLLWSLSSVEHSNSAARGVSPDAFWETSSWKAFEQWSRSEVVRFHQGSLGQSWSQPTALGTNLPLRHLRGLPPQGSPQPPTKDQPYGWSVGLMKEIVEAFEGRVKGPSVEELDRMISEGYRRKSDELSDGSASSDSSSVTVSAPSEANGQVVIQTPQAPELSIGALTAAQKEEWKAHVQRGHIPYRRDCKFCVEGSGLGLQHRRIKNPQAYTLSVDLFGPMSGLERGRDEQSVSGNPHIKFGLVGAFRLPRSVVLPPTEISSVPAPQEGVDQSDDHARLEEELAEYEPSLDCEEEDAEPFPELLQGVAEQTPVIPDKPDGLGVSAVDGDSAGDKGLGPIPAFQEEDSIPQQLNLDEEIEQCTAGVELVTLRYVVGLKSKSGSDVTAGVQKLILEISRLYPVKVLHCDPGTEFGSDRLSTWLSGQGVRLQTTVPTDKQANGVAERTVGWMKSRARTLLSSAELPAGYWPLAMRYAAECQNRQVLKLPQLPAFGQPVFHKLKRPSGAHKELMTRWIDAYYAAPHLTIPDGHVLVTKEGNLVASKGFRTNLVDVRLEPDLELPTLHTEEEVPEAGDKAHLKPVPEVMPEASILPLPSKRLKEKTSVRGVSFCEDWDASPEQLARAALLDEDYSDSCLRRVLTQLTRAEVSTEDRRGDFDGRYVLEAYCHGGQRGVTTLARKYPALVRLLNRALQRRLPEEEGLEDLRWGTLLLMHAAEVPVHRDYRNEWETSNVVICVPGQHELWLGPPHKPGKEAIAPEPDWDSGEVKVLGPRAARFNPRNYHAVRRSPDWLIVGFSPLGTHKLKEVDLQFLEGVGFPLPGVPGRAPQVRALQAAPSSTDCTLQGQPASSSSDPSVTRVGVDLNEDLQSDSYTPVVGWDPSGNGSLNRPQYNLEEADFYQYLKEREVEWTYQRLTVMGVESPADLEYLYMEDLVEFGLPIEDAQRVMMGIHPAGTMRPDNPNGISLTTGEVCLYDRMQRQIPRVIQNRTLNQHAPGPPVPGLGIVGPQARPDPYVEDWVALQDPEYAEGMNLDVFLPTAMQASPGSEGEPPEVSAVFLEESLTTPGAERPSSSTDPPYTGRGASSCGEQAWDGDVPSMHAMRMQAIWEARDEEEFQALVNFPIEVQGGLASGSAVGSVACEPAEVSTVFLEESPSTPGSSNYGCRMVQMTPSVRDPFNDEADGVSHSRDVSYRCSAGEVPQLVSRIDVPMPEIMSVRGMATSSQDTAQLPSPITPRVERVEESAFTQDIESLLENLDGPLEVVHQVSPSDVRKNLDRWKPSAQDEVSSLEKMGAIVRHTGEAARRLLRQPEAEVIPSKGGVSEDILYASGAAAETLRMLLIHGGSKRRQCWSTDIKCAFLLAPIPDNVRKTYVLKPPAILIALGICSPDEYWEVKRAVYGFKESPKWWAQFRDSELQRANFLVPEGQATLRKTSSDENLWEMVLSDGTNVGYVLVYVDDILMVSSRLVAEAFHAWIKDRWECSDLEQATAHKALRFLGVDVYEAYDAEGPCGFTLSQEGYIDESLVPIPKDWVKNAPEEEADYPTSSLRDAQRITGELLWVSQRTRDLRLSLVPEGPEALSIYTDASFAPFSERSISGIVVLMNNKCVFWKSKRQTLVSLSTAECELIAAVEGVVLGQSVQALAADLWRQEIDKTLYVDNVAAITLAEGGGSQRTRHLRVRACYLREMLEEGRLKVLHCPGDTQRADALTKALPAPRLGFLNDLLGVGPPPPQDPVIRTVMTASRSFQQASPTDGYSVLLLLALTMIQVTPATSQEEEEAETLGIDLYVLGVMLACSILFVWEVGKHCIRECHRFSSERPLVASLTVDENDDSRRSRRQQAVRRALEREIGGDVGSVNLSARTTGADSPVMPAPPPTTQASSHVHLHMSPATVQGRSRGLDVHGNRHPLHLADAELNEGGRQGTSAREV
ncbi:RE1 [Symbiodinium sp. CCMP2592]|nr:RE1 [Symbiodinium sp. CCMP2592]